MKKIFLFAIGFIFVSVSLANACNFKIANFVVTDINTDGTLEGTNEVFIKKILEITDIPVIASGGIGSISDLLSLKKFEHYGLYGIIVGKALYENKFTISEANNILST